MRNLATKLVNEKLLSSETSLWISEYGVDKTILHLVNTIKQLEIIYDKTNKVSTRDRIKELTNELKLTRLKYNKN